MYLDILESKNPCSRCWLSCPPIEGSRGDSFLVSSGFKWHQVFLGLGLKNPSLCFHFAFHFHSYSLLIFSLNPWWVSY